MNISDQFTNQQRLILYGFILVLLAPALLINLGMMSLIDDESIRVLVALEMDITGNYIVPTMNGEYYYNKPPLFNWYLLLWFKLFGVFNEFVARFAVVISLLAYATTIFYYSKKHYSTKFAFLNALFIITCGRILIYDSMLGLIDISFSWITFLGFMVVYHHYEKKKYYTLFLISYFLAALGFLMKGLPSLVFQGATLLAFFIYQKDLKRFFSLAHVLGGLLFLVVVGSYYFVYNQYNSLETVFNTLANESTKRTATQYGIGKTILHLFTFPFEIIYHFLPWTLLAIYFFKKNIRSILQQDSFILYCLLIFFANILVYWISVEVYPRYLFMHLPLLFTTLLYLHFKNEEQNSLYYKIIHTILGFLCGILTIAMLTPFFLENTQQTTYLYPKTLLLVGLSGTLCVLFWKYKKERLLLTIAVLLVARLGFNWFVIPDRYNQDWGTKVKLSSIDAGQKYKDVPLYIYKGSVVNRPNSFYISNITGKILKKKRKPDNSEDIFIVNPLQYSSEVDYKKVNSLKIIYRQFEIDIAENLQLKTRK